MRPFVELLRVKHWVKNAAVLATLPFAWLQHGSACIQYMVPAFVAFCFISSSSYIFNDILDRHEDLLHPKKKHRPIASGAITVPQAVGLSFCLLVAALAIGAWMAVPKFLAALLGYYVLILAYSLVLKHQPILDVIVIATGFVIRVAAGALAVDVYVSPWLIACTFTLCLFLGFGKRRCEINAINSMAEAVKHRKTLTKYTADLLNQLLSTSAGIALVTFLLYIMENEKLPGQQIVFNKAPLLYTFPLVVYGLFRYAMLIETVKEAGPTEIILRDRTLMLVILCWTITSALIILV